MWTHNHPIPEDKLGATVTPQQIMDKFVEGIIPKPENYYSNWPPPPRPTIDEIKDRCANSDVYKWIQSLQPTDQIRKFNNIGILCGSAGYVAFRDGKQVSAYDRMRS